jgi:hypothetical protein
MKAYTSINSEEIKIKYKVGKTYTFKCFKNDDCFSKNDWLFLYGFYCHLDIDVFGGKDIMYFEVEVLGETLYSDSIKENHPINNELVITDKIKIIREIKKTEYNKLSKQYKYDDRGNIIQHTTSHGDIWKTTYNQNNEYTFKELFKKEKTDDKNY